MKIFGYVATEIISPVENVVWDVPPTLGNCLLLVSDSGRVQLPTMCQGEGTPGSWGPGQNSSASWIVFNIHKVRMYLSYMCLQLIARLQVKLL